MDLFRTVDRISQGLDGASLRHRVLSNNLANANTPLFRRSDVDFLQQLTQADRIPLGRSNARHLPGLTHERSGFRVQQDTSTALRNDGSNVDVEREMVLVLENQLHYQAMVDVTSRNLGLLRSVIGEGRR